MKVSEICKMHRLYPSIGEAGRSRKKTIRTWREQGKSVDELFLRAYRCPVTTLDGVKIGWHWHLTSQRDPKHSYDRNEDNS